MMKEYSAANRELMPQKLSLVAPLVKARIQRRGMDLVLDSGHGEEIGAVCRPCQALEKHIPSRVVIKRR